MRAVILGEVEVEVVVKEDGDEDEEGMVGMYNSELSNA